jgi:integrase
LELKGELFLFYSVINVSVDKDNPFYLLTYKDMPLYEPNRFVQEKGRNSFATQKDYFNILCNFFNFYEDHYKIVDFRKIYRKTALSDYIEHKVYSKKIVNGNTTVFVKSEETLITANTANKYITVIQEFYYQLDKPLIDNIEINVEYSERWAEKHNKHVHKTKYNGIWGTTNIEDLPCIIQNTKWKKQRKEVKTFSDSEIDIIATNFTILRNKCIFLLILETACRISEALFIKKKDFIFSEEANEGKGAWVVFISKSKTTQRWVLVPDYLAKLINEYISTERKIATDNLPKFSFLFVSEKGRSKGEKIGYSTFRNNLKMVAKQGGIDETKVCVHMTRATKATALKREGFTDLETLKLLGNKSTLEPYKELNRPGDAIVCGKNLYNINTNKGTVLKL